MGNNISDLGPLAYLVGVWEGDKGKDDDLARRKSGVYFNPEVEMEKRY